MTSFQEDFYPESQFGGFTDVDGTVTFYTRTRELLERDDTVVDFGCGRGKYKHDDVSVRRSLRILQDQVNRVVGLDVDAEARDNPFLDTFHLLNEQSRWPLDANTVDCVVSDMVLEHLRDPEYFFAEASRVLKTGGYLCVRTPNMMSYPAIISALIPDDLHAQALQCFQEDERSEEDVFPTQYRCNTINAIEKCFETYDFQGVVYGHRAEPQYLDFSKWAYALGVLYERIVPHQLQPVLFGFGQYSPS